MIQESLSFTQQVVGSERLSADEVDAFLSSVPVKLYELDPDVDEDENDVPETLEDVEGYFRSMSGPSQRLLVRGFSSGLLSDEFVNDELREFRDVLGLNWSGTDEYASLEEAVEFYDARFSSVLLVWEFLGSSLKQLGLSEYRLRSLVEFALHGYVSEYSTADELRLSTVEEIEACAAVATYVVVDWMIEKEMRLGFDGRGVIVVHEMEWCPRSNEGEGTNATKSVVVHQELERLLRGRSVDDYVRANRFVRERDLGATVGEARLVIEHLELEASALAGGLL